MTNQYTPYELNDDALFERIKQKKKEARRAAGIKTACYVCSRVKHAERWKKYRADGAHIISSWIDEAGVGETENYSELWTRIQDEVQRCDALVMLLEPDDFPLKGALVEVGMAIAYNKPVFVYAKDVVMECITFRPVGSWIKHPNVIFVTDLDKLFKDME